MAHFRDDPQHPGVRVWRRSRGPFWFSAIAAGVTALLAIGMTAVFGYVAIAFADWWFRLFAAALLAVMWGLFAYVRRDAVGKAHARITIDDAGIDLDLAANRSLVHRPPRCRRRLAWSEIASLDTRMEGFGAQGMAMLQRPYWLRLKDGGAILLFEERAVATAMEDMSMADVAAEIAARGHLATNELPMVAGKGGILGTWFVTAPALDAVPLDKSGQRSMMRRVWLTGALAGLAIFVVIIGYSFA